MPIISTINIQKAVVNKKATIYKKPPQRNFSNVSDEQDVTLSLVYRDMMLNRKLNQSNKDFISQGQSVGMIVPKNGKLVCRILKMHHFDVIPDYDDPETAMGYIVSAFDRTDYLAPFSEGAIVIKKMK